MIIFEEARGCRWGCGQSVKPLNYSDILAAGLNLFPVNNVMININ